MVFDALGTEEASFELKHLLRHAFSCDFAVPFFNLDTE